MARAPSLSKSRATAGEQNRQTLVHGIVDYRLIKGVVFVPESIAEAPYLMKRHIWRNYGKPLLTNLHNGFRNSLQAALDCIDKHLVSRKLNHRKVREISLRRFAILDDISQALLLAIRRHEYDPGRYSAASAPFSLARQRDPLWSAKSLLCGR